MLAQKVANSSKLDASGSTSVAKQERSLPSGVTSEARWKFNFIKKTIDKLPLPTNGQRRYVYDSQTRGLALAVSPAGKKAFVLYRKVAGRPERITIGPYPDLTIEQARGQAAELNGKIARGENPASKRRGSRDEMTLGELLDDYISRHLKRHAKRPDVAETNARWMFTKYLTRWRGRTLGIIRRKDVLAIQAEIAENAGHTSSNRVLQLLRAMFNFAISEELWSGENPCSRVKLFHENKRLRFVQPDEMPRLFAALKSEPNPDVIDYVSLALWTGARKTDVLSARWTDISLADNRWTIPDPKNRQPYTVALTPEAISILNSRQNDSPWVFPGSGASGHIVDLKGRWKELLKRAKITNLRQHDLRRTLGSWQAAQGASLQIIGKSLGHQSTAATQVYSQLNLDPVRASVGAATQAMIAASKRKPVNGPARLLGDGNG